jgi:ATP-dependent RNA helicase RhlE
MKFEDYAIDQSIKDQLQVLGFKRPTDIQYRAIKHILDGEDVMAVAQTGTGLQGQYPLHCFGAYS